MEGVELTMTKRCCLSLGLPSISSPVRLIFSTLCSTTLFAGARRDAWAIYLVTASNRSVPFFRGRSMTFRLGLIMHMKSDKKVLEKTLRHYSACYRDCFPICDGRKNCGI